MKKVTSTVPSAVVNALNDAVDAKNPKLGAAAYTTLVDNKASQKLQDAVYDLNSAFDQLTSLQTQHDNIKPANGARYGADDKLVAEATFSEGQVKDRQEYKRRIGMYEKAISEATTSGCLCKIQQLRQDPALKEWAKDESAPAQA